MQMVIVILILVATVLLTVRWIVRAAKGNDSGCGCGNCPMNGSKDCHCRDKAAGLPEKDFDD